MRRNYGLDFARIFAMFSVVLLHNLLQGGILRNPKLAGGNWFSMYFLENLAIIAVNIFAMLTGYLYVNKKVKPSRVMGIIFEALFWSWTIVIVLILCGYNITKIDVLKSILPVWNYWYVNAYIAVILLVPILNKGIQALSKNSFKIILLSLIIISVTIGFVTKQFFLNRGYSGYWLVIMYLLGAYIKKISKNWSL